MANSVNFNNAELSSLKIGTAKTGNQYISGFLVDSNPDGSYTTSKAFRSFDAVVISALPAELVARATDTKVSFPKGTRPRISMEGWLQNKADAKGVWSETLIVTAIK
jgi:hypothetical protein